MKFFIIDDDISICQLLALYLSKHARCLHATEGTKALKIFNAHLKEKEPFTAIFMDIEMPGIKGHDVVELFRKTEEAYGIKPADRFKLFMVSSHDNINNVTTSFLKNQAASFIKKPFTEEALDKELHIAGLI